MPSHFRLTLVLCVSVFSMALYAENQDPNKPAMQSPLPSDRSVKLFDDAVFKLSPNPETSEYTSSDYARWTRTCEHLKEKDMQSFRDCFASEKRKDMAKGAEPRGSDSPRRRQNSIETVSDPYDGVTDGSGSGASSGAGKKGSVEEPVESED